MCSPKRAIFIDTNNNMKGLLVKIYFLLCENDWIVLASLFIVDVKICNTQNIDTFCRGPHFLVGASAKNSLGICLNEHKRSFFVHPCERSE